MNRLSHPAVRLPAIALAVFVPFLAVHGWALWDGVLGPSLLFPALGITVVGPPLVLLEWNFVMGVAHMVGAGEARGVAALVLTAVVLLATPAAGVWAWRQPSWPRLLLWAACLLLWFVIGLRMWLVVWAVHSG